MAFSFQDIRYGWVALAALGVITGVTIYTLTPTRKQVKPQDIIELALGTDERCMGLQTADGVYLVARPSIVRTWTSNVYTTNGVTIYTNIVTNTIGWHPDRDMMVSLDTTIKALVPYYVDTNTVYDGTTNIVMLTVTGLWASLGIGDKTNQFTRTPCWTNPISTNWIVNYTSYWPSTNGTTTNINYTSDYRQVVNYAQSWTATGGHVWVTSSNWASSVVTKTNAATYGDYPWQIYVEDLQERYKVLNALKMVKLPTAFEVSSSNRYTYLYGGDYGPYSWSACQTWVNYYLNSGIRGSLYLTNGSGYVEGIGVSGSGKGIRTWGYPGCWAGADTQKLKVIGPTLFNTNLAVIDAYCQQFIFEQIASVVMPAWPWDEQPISTNIFKSYANGPEIYTNVSERTVIHFEGANEFLIDFPAPEWLAAPVSQIDVYGAKYDFVNSESYIRPQFNYCTNKYW